MGENPLYDNRMVWSWRGTRIQNERAKLKIDLNGLTEFPVLSRLEKLTLSCDTPEIRLLPVLIHFAIQHTLYRQSGYSCL